MEDTITTERIERYLAITAEARAKATPSTSSQEDEAVLQIMLQMCDAYATDSRHFVNEGDLVSAFGAINYAHAWLDAAVKIGLMDGHGDDRLFTLP